MRRAVDDISHASGYASVLTINGYTNAWPDIITGIRTVSEGVNGSDHYTIEYHLTWAYLHKGDKLTSYTAGPVIKVYPLLKN